ncbi:hypothetical protein CCR75_001966 [Bremia lactucae]|uniref:ER membrane protein complex subunit 10 n=1 Tax=Bremia lactucae TaxID=4779 RepID=A0A976IL59_BRELC|nr:hypothetical protein CCR75_001966 [Bremia lactucae]
MTLSNGSCMLFMCFTAILMATTALADPHEIQTTDFTEEFGDDFEDVYAVSAIGELKMHLQFDLEHQLVAGAEFTPRGIVTIVTSASNPKSVVSFSALPPLSVDDVEKLNFLLQQDRFYTVRAKADPDDPQSPYVMASVPMCMLAVMRLREDFAFHLSDSGKLVAIEYLTPYVESDVCTDSRTRSLEDMHLSPSGTVFKVQGGPLPPKNVVGMRDRAPQGVKPVKSEENNDEPEEASQSFLRKYWYIILPIIVMSLFGGDGGTAAAGRTAGASATPAVSERQR